MKTRFFIIITLTALLLAGCASSAEQTQPPSLFPGQELTPFATGTATPTITPTSINIPTATPSPTVTPTPISYTVKTGETLWEIAARYNLTQDQILDANPTLKPYLLNPGTVIIIPTSAGGAITQAAPESTPYPVDLSDPSCTPSLSGGLYCFAEIVNSQTLIAGNISASFVLLDPESGETRTQAALVPLSHIRSGESLPVFTYFQPPVAASYSMSLQLQSATSINNTGTPTPIQAAVIQVDQQEINISANGLSVQVNAQATLQGEPGLTGRVWIAAVAYDAQGQIVGVRRYQSDNTLAVGESIPFTLNIYSIGEKITRVEFFGEAGS